MDRVWSPSKGAWHRLVTALPLGKKVIYGVDLTRSLDCASWLRHIVCPCGVAKPRHGPSRSCSSKMQTHSILWGENLCRRTSAGKKKNCIRLQKKTPLAFHERPLWKDIDHHEQSADTFKTCIIGQTALQVKWGRGWISGWKLMSSLHPPRRLRVRLLFCLLA